MSVRAWTSGEAAPGSRGGGDGVTISAAGAPQHSLACRCIPPTLTSILTWHSPWVPSLCLHMAIFFRGHQSYQLRGPSLSVTSL